jgi:hypothetical protein
MICRQTRRLNSRRQLILSEGKTSFRFDCAVLFCARNKDGDCRYRVAPSRIVFLRDSCRILKRHRVYKLRHGRIKFGNADCVTLL